MMAEHLKLVRRINMFEIQLDEKDLQILDQALTQLPYYQVAELISKINQQISEQVDSED